MKTKDWFKDRGYPHFSNKTPLTTRDKVEMYVSSSNNIAQHSFYPLILKEIKQRRYKLSNVNGVLKRSHKSFENGVFISNTKVRQILYSTHIDAHIYSYYTKEISKFYESYISEIPQLCDVVTAYRQIKTECGKKYKGNIHFAKDVFDEIKKRKDCVALCFDIEQFFPSLDHKLLKIAWAKLLDCKSLPKDHYNIFKAVTNYSFVKLNDLRSTRSHFDEKKLAKHRKSGKNTFFESIRELIDSDILIYKNERKNSNGNIIGIPQGLPISALLANVYMISFDKAVIEGLVRSQGVFYRRYSDDIVIVCNRQQVEDVENFIKEEIEKIKLVISIPKTEVTEFNVVNDVITCARRGANGDLKANIPLGYLGFEFYGNKTLIKSKNLAAFYREMKNTIRRKNSRIEKIKEKYLIDSAPIFKRKIYRLYTYKGIKTRYIPVKETSYKNGVLVIKNFSRKYRGNFIKYAYRASVDMDAPEIKKQLRRHWRILQKSMQKYNFSNVKDQ